LPADAQALWHALMYLNNRCAVCINGNWAWRVEFTVSNTTLLSILKFSRQQLDRMRNALIQMGRIEYKKGRGNQSGTYKMIPFDANNVTQTVTQPVTHSGTQPVTQTVTQVWHINNNNLNPNFNSNNYDVDDDAAGADVRDEAGKLLTPKILFSECFQKEPAPFESKRCDQLLHLHDPDLVEYAFERSAEMGQKTLAYVQGILNRMAQRGIHDMGDLADWDMKAGDI